MSDHVARVASIVCLALLAGCGIHDPYRRLNVTASTSASHAPDPVGSPDASEDDGPRAPAAPDLMPQAASTPQAALIRFGQLVHQLDGHRPSTTRATTRPNLHWPSARGSAPDGQPASHARALPGPEQRQRCRNRRRGRDRAWALGRDHKRGDERRRTLPRAPSDKPRDVGDGRTPGRRLCRFDLVPGELTS